MTFVKKINTALIILDIIIMVAIMVVFFYSVTSLSSFKAEKTEDFLKQFMSVLNIIYFLAKIAAAHMFINLIYHFIKKAKIQAEGAY